MAELLLIIYQLLFSATSVDKCCHLYVLVENFPANLRTYYIQISTYVQAQAYN